MKIFKDIKDVEFNDTNVYGTWMPVSEPIAMASAAGWYVGSIDNSEGFIQPYDRYTDYMTKESAVAEAMIMKEPISEIV